MERRLIELSLSDYKNNLISQCIFLLWLMYIYLIKITHLPFSLITAILSISTRTIKSQKGTIYCCTYSKNVSNETKKHTSFLF